MLRLACIFCSILLVSCMDQNQIDDLKEYRAQRDRQLVEDIAFEMQRNQPRECPYCEETFAELAKLRSELAMANVSKRSSQPFRSGVYVLNDSTRVYVHIDTLE